jgi:HK97 family phage portal protein
MPNIVQALRNLFGRNEYHIELTPEQIPIIEGLTARQLYATQSNLHTVVSFLSASVAQLPLKVYKRDGENARARDRDSAAAKLLWKPNPDQTCYEFIEGLITEYLLMGSVFAWVLPDADSESGYQLRIIPREWIVDTISHTNYAPDMIKVCSRSGSIVEVPRDMFVQFRMYNPGNPGGYQSPIASLKQVLTEQVNADRFRTDIWRSSGRFNAYLTRPANVQPWDEGQRKAFIQAFREGWGASGENRGKMPLLEDGMDIKTYQFNAREAQYAETKQLSREDVAAAYHVNPSLIWHTTTQTYASAKDNARALYADCLGPTLQMLQQRINSFLLPMIGADPTTYVEFDLNEKLKGSFEERAGILQSSVGGPWLTRNEARADNNLPPIEGGDELIVPLNVIEGGQASPTDTHMQSLSRCSCTKEKSKKEQTKIKARSSKEEDELMTEALKKFFKRQASSIIPKLGAKSAAWWDEDRWNTELADDIEPIINQISDAHGKEAAAALGANFDTARTRKYLRALSEGRATAINAATYKKLQEAMDSEEEEDTPEHVFEVREDADAGTFGRSLATAVAGWAMIHEAPQQAEDQGIHKLVEKTWVTGTNPRLEHMLMNGETVLIDEEFSNGCFWPGDEGGDPDTTCGCNCSTEITITEE